MKSMFMLYKVSIRILWISVAAEPYQIKALRLGNETPLGGIQTAQPQSLKLPRLHKNIHSGGSILQNHLKCPPKNGLFHETAGFK